MAADCSRSVAVAAWHLILENACSLNDSGRIEVSPRRIAAALVEPLATITKLHAAMVDLRLITSTHVVAWKTRQYESDSSTERSRRYRAKIRAETGEVLPSATDATLQDVAATDQSQSQRQNIPEANASGHAVPRLSASEITRAIFETGVLILCAAGHQNRQARSIVGRWRKANGDAALLAALSRCEVEQPTDPVAWMTRALEIGSGNWKHGRTHEGRAGPSERAPGRTEQAARLAFERRTPAPVASSAGGDLGADGELFDTMRACSNDG